MQIDRFLALNQQDARFMATRVMAALSTTYFATDPTRYSLRKGYLVNII